MPYTGVFGCQLHYRTGRKKNPQLSSILNLNITCESHVRNLLSLEATIKSELLQGPD